MNRCQGFILTLALAGTVACRGPAQYVNQGADLSAVKTVAVLPFENLTSESRIVAMSFCEPRSW